MRSGAGGMASASSVGGWHAVRMGAVRWCMPASVQVKHPRISEQALAQGGVGEAQGQSNGCAAHAVQIMPIIHDCRSVNTTRRMMLCGCFLLKQKRAQSETSVPQSDKENAQRPENRTGPRCNEWGAGGAEGSRESIRSGTNQQLLRTRN